MRPESLPGLVLFLALVSPLFALDEPPAARHQVEKIVEKLAAVKAEGKELLGGKVKADEYLAALDVAQDEIVAVLATRGVVARKIARYDFGGLQGPRMLKGARREVQEDAVISSSGHLEIGRGRIAGAVLIEAAGESFINRFARTLLDRFAVRTVIEAGSIDNETAAASFNGEGSYMSIPLHDAIADGISYATYHEMVHMVRHAVKATDPSVFDAQVSGDDLKSRMNDPLYGNGFTIDEMAAYPEGVHFSVSLRASEGTPVAVPHSGAGGWKVLDARIAGPRLNLLSTDKHRQVILQQLVDLEGKFLAVTGELSTRLPDARAPGRVQAMGLLGEDLILSAPGYPVRYSLGLLKDGLFGDGVLRDNPSLTVHGVDVKLSIEMPLDAARAAGAAEHLRTLPTPGQTEHAIDSAIGQVWEEAVQRRTELMGALPGLVADLGARHTRLKVAIEAGSLDQAEAIVGEMVDICRRVTRAGPHGAALDALRAELGL